MSEASDNFVFDILCDLCFRRSFETQVPGEKKLRTVPANITAFMIVSYNVRASVQPIPPESDRLTNVTDYVPPTCRLLAVDEAART
jgi:hypothetical protein